MNVLILLTLGADREKLIKKWNIIRFINKNYTADHMVLVGTGGVDHEELVN